MGGEHLSTTRRATHVAELHAMVERGQAGRLEVWDVAQLAAALDGLRLGRARLGFELGDCTTLGMSYLDFERLRARLPRAELVDGAPILRRCLQLHTPLEIDRVRVACVAAESMHRATPELLVAGLDERAFMRSLEAHFASLAAQPPGVLYRAEGGWDLRSASRGRWSPFHGRAGDWFFAAGDVVARATGGTTYRGPPRDVDRTFCVGTPSDAVRRRYDGAVACLRAMRAAIRPGAECADVYAAYAAAARAAGWPERVVGRQGHGVFNGGGISVHPDCHLVLEPGMIVSCEPVLATEEGLFDVEDQFLVTESGREPLHPELADGLPVVPA
jgi:Xaa-Pro aminopeptidase